MSVLTISRVARHGDGVAEMPLGPVHVARALPGEVVEGEVRDGRIDEPRVLLPSAERVAPPCPHFRRCGACALQHASDGFVAGWKRERVARALARAGVAAEVRGPATSPPGSRRRAALKGRRTKKGAMVGFHARASHDLVAIPGCRVLRPEIVAALPALEAVARIAAPRGGEVGLHVTVAREGLDLAVTGAKALAPEGLGALAGFARVTWNGEPAVQSARPTVRLGPAVVPMPPAAFLQATEEGERALTAAVLAITRRAGRVLDLFAGLGTFALPLAARASVHAVEADAAALEALRLGARAPGLRPVTTERRDLFREPLRPDELTGFDAVVLDPPRAGASAQVAMLARSGVRRVAYVSCDPDSFARDAALFLAGGYRPGPVAVVDQFRWSPHTETVAAFAREP